jgi:pyruvate/2-oxoglutarate dehydrogenase complex dihydrolipoamide dehydrogenase (E3) component
MRAEYDLVVIGDSLAARWAALSAVRHYARVAFIQQSKSDLLARSVLFQELAGLVTTSISQGLPFPFETVSSLRLWLVRRGAELLKPLGLNRLAHNGVDVLTTPGNFLSPDPQTPFPIFESQGRQFRSRYYLLAMDAAIAFNANQSQLSDLQPLEAILSKIESFTCQDQIFIQGRYPWAILLGQILNRLGYSITIFGEESILSREDPDISFHFQCQLESQAGKFGFRKFTLR